MRVSRRKNTPAEGTASASHRGGKVFRMFKDKLQRGWSRMRSEGGDQTKPKDGRWPGQGAYTPW